MTLTLYNMTDEASYREQFPLHHAIRDPDLSERAVVRILREAYRRDPASIGQTDDEGRTPLAVATVTANLPVVAALIDMARADTADGEDILGLQVADRLQETPASLNLRFLRENPRFMMFDLLETASKQLTAAYIANRLPPCLCGKCEDGWFSPRMRFRLREIARRTCQEMHSGLSKFTDGERLDGELVITDRPVTFLPIPVLEKGIYKPFYIGYRAAFQAMIDILSQSGPDSIPTVQRLRVELANGARDGRYHLEAVQYFAESGGSVRFALDYVIHQALWESPTPLGDGSFDKLWDEPFSPPLTIPMSPIPTDLKENPRRRSRSNSLKEALNPFGRRRGSVSLDNRRNVSIEPRMEFTGEEKEKIQKWTLQQEWDASGDPGCPLDTQFGGARYLLGLHEEARWEIALDDVDPRGKRPSCELRRM